MAPAPDAGAFDAPADPFPVIPAPRPIDRWYELVDRCRASPARALGLLAAVVALGVAVWWLARPPAPPVEVELPRARPAPISAPATVATAAPGAAGSGAGSSGPSGVSGASGPTGTAFVIVQAAGAVNQPGVYRMPTGSRVDDLVRRAGGLASAADGDRVNLAAPVADGERVWLPRRGEGDPPVPVAGASVAPPSGAGAAGPGSGSTAPAAPVDLNTATAEQLDTLPGVGPATAAAIIAHRTQHGRFAAVEDLLDVRGIGDAKLEQLRPLARV